LREYQFQSSRVYGRLKHCKGEPYDEEKHTPAYSAELRERGVRLF
jgi:hypothetical protein